MYVTVWRFITNDPEEFERHYGPDGTWVRLFRRSADYLRTDLLRGAGEYMTLDWWTSRESYEAFRSEHASEYGEIDRMCEALTASEVQLGEYQAVGRPGRR